MKSALIKNLTPDFAFVLAAICFVVSSPVAPASVITGTHNFAIVERLTGTQLPDHAGRVSINPTWNVGIGGTDLGFSVNHNGKTYFLFGDTFDGEATAGSGGPDWRFNVMAYSTDSTPADGITFDDWITRPNGTAKQVIFPGAEQGIPGFGPITYIPTGAISANNKIYTWSMRIDWDGFPEPPGEPSIDGWMLSHAGLASWRVGDSQFTDVPGFRFEAPAGGAYSWAGGAEGPGNFGMVAASYRSPFENANDPHIYIWGTPGGREGGVKLARVLPNNIENLSAYEFFDGEINGAPQWVGNEFDAQKIIPSRLEGGTGVGEMSVMYNEELRAWTLMYITGGPSPDFEIRQADNPWGPWSAPITVADHFQAPGGIYSPYMNPLYVEDNGKTLYFTMSLWDPYDVYLAKVTLDIDYRTQWTGTIGSWAINGSWSDGQPTAQHVTTLDNGGTIRINTTAAARELVVGTGAGLGGTVELTGAAALDVQNGNVRLAQGQGSDATFTMTGGSLQVLGTGRQFIVGDSGAATATISGGSITARSFSIAHQPSANGHVELSGDTVITILGDRFQMGRLRNTSTGESPTASLTMTGGTINVNPGGVSPSLRDFVVGWEGAATVDMSGGTINANNFSSAVLGTSGAAPASQAITTHSGGTITTGAMTLGERGISDYTLSGTGEIKIRGLMRLGWLVGSQSTFTQNGGAVSVALDNPASTFIGLKVGEAGHGTYTINGGSLNVPGSLIVADLNGSTGQLNINGGSVNAGGLLRVRSAGTVNLDGGTLTAAAIQHNEGGAFHFTGGTLLVGTFTGNLTNTGGTLAPGSSAGTTGVTGNYTQLSDATLAIEIGGFSPSTQHDQVNVTGAAMLGGQLQLALLDGFLPSAGETFTILSATSLSGTFINVAAGERLTTTDSIGSFLVHYGPGSSFDPNQIVLTGFQLAGDFNQDGLVDAADYVLWRRGLANGTMNDGHYDQWRGNFGTVAGGAGTGATKSAFNGVVPEPSSFSISMLLLIAILLCRHSARY